MNTRGNQEECVMQPPYTFVWTRYGAEAGQSFEDILRRKEIERSANGGVFLWGIGNNIVASLDCLLDGDNCPRVLFSPIKSIPRSADVAPEAVAVWASAVTPTGMSYALPQYSVVTSRFHPRKRKHFALVCCASSPLELDQEGPVLSKSNLVNAKSGNRLGSSQVTAIVRSVDHSLEYSDGYNVTFSCDLVYPFVITLGDPVVSLPDEESISNAIRRANLRQRQLESAEQMNFSFVK